MQGICKKRADSEKYGGLEEREGKMEYYFVRVVGEGAFSKVYLARTGTGRLCACKVSAEKEMLKKEADLLGELYHPLFPAYLDYEEQGGKGMLAMEYIRGENMARMLMRRRGFCAEQTLRFAAELADGLRYLHHRQPAVLYRDLKPENVMVCQDGHLKLIDLGCACRLGEEKSCMAGTVGFAPPEQLKMGRAAGIYSDVYGLGRTVQSMLGERERDVKEKNTYHKRLKRLMDGCLCEDPGQRFPDMIGVMGALMGKRAKEKDVICEKNIWESHYKNACSLPPI